MTPHIDQRLIVNSTYVISETANDQVLAIYMELGTYYTFDGSAAVLWNALLNGISVGQLYALAAHHYSGDEVAMQQAIDAFLTRLRDERLIVPAPPSTAPWELPISNGDRTPFIAPRLMRFNDIQMMLVANPLKFETTFTPVNANIVSEQYGDETVVLDMNRGYYYSFRGSAATVWAGIIEKENFRAILERVQAAFHGDAAAIQDQVGLFLEDLRKEALIVFGSTDDSPGFTPPAAASKQPFDTPRFERFTDLQGMLLLDPIHDVAPQGWPLASTSDDISQAAAD
ncbi:MAG: PqqD family protein [bacterium]|nr:PqqD family protein [bacterium]